MSWIAIVAFGFAQMAIAAHACLLQAPAAAVSMAAVAADQGREPCEGMDGAPAHAQSNACEAHCANAIGAPTQPDIPPAAFTALPLPAVVAADVPTNDRSSPEAPLAVSRAPPLTLRFCRLLI